LLSGYAEERKLVIESPIPAVMRLLDVLELRTAPGIEIRAAEGFTEPKPG
jgi:hypothetical protein